MTFEELDALYENGLVDAEISKISIDYENRSAEFRLRRNPASSPDAEVYSEAILRITTFCYVSIDPPDDHHAEFARRRIQFNALNEDPSTFPLLAAIGAKVHPDAFVCRFFVHDWNSFIHLAAHDANLSRRVVSCDKYSESTRPPFAGHTAHPSSGSFSADDCLAPNCASTFSIVANNSTLRIGFDTYPSIPAARHAS